MLPAVIAVVTGAFIAAESPASLAIAMMEGNLVAAVLVAAGLAGGWLVPLIGLSGASWYDRLLVGAGLGIGGLSLMVLGLGSAGLLTRPVAFALILLLAIAALLRVGVDIYAGLKQVVIAEKTNPAEAKRIKSERFAALALSGLHWTWLITCPFLAITVLAATLPPGVLWAEEAGGYDVLEYHLAVPKAFHEAGHIFFMPYNAYSNFPSNSEMLSLLMMTLRGDAIESALMCTLVNAVLAGLFVAAAWWVGRFFSRPAGIVAGVVAACTPWIAYLAGIAYVEVGMLALGMLAFGAVLHAGREQGATLRWLTAAGLLAGLSCGYKYTAIPLIGLPIGLLILFLDTPWRTRVTGLLIYGLAGLATFSPWMIRNLVNTHNPVFPLAYSVFGAKTGTWDDELQQRWQRGHSLEGAGLDGVQSKWIGAVGRTILDPRMGIVTVALALLGGLARRDRWTVALLAMLALQVVVWYLATHLFARFAVVMLLPLLVLIARLVESPGRLRTGMILGLVVLGALLNLDRLYALYYDHTRTAGRPIQAFGHVNWFADGDWPGMEYLKVVNALPKGSHLMLVGEARTFYIRTPREYAVVFNHHPLARAVQEFRGGSSTQPAMAASMPDLQDGPADRQVLKWLAKRGTTHLLVNWMELERLAGSYGLDEALTPNLFVRLESAGLERMGDFMIEDGGPPYATLYEVPHE